MAISRSLQAEVSCGVIYNFYFFLKTEKDVNCLEPWLIKEMDACLSDIWLHKDVDAFAQVFHLILTENVSGKPHLCIYLFMYVFIYLCMYLFIYF